MTLWRLGLMLFAAMMPARQCCAIQTFGCDSLLIADESESAEAYFDNFHFTSPAVAHGLVVYPSASTGVVRKAVVYTRDGGRSWKHQFPEKFERESPSPAEFFLNDKIGWIAYRNYETAFDFVAKTNDGGRTWAIHEAPLINAFVFFDESNGYSAGADVAGTFFRTTRDGGDTWSDTPLALRTVDAMYFESPSHGFVAGLKGAAPSDSLAILVTHDGGATWVPASVHGAVLRGEPKVYAGPSRQQLFLVVTSDVVGGGKGGGSVFLKTNNGGDDWLVHPQKGIQGSGRFIEAIAINGRKGIGFVTVNNSDRRRARMISSSNGGQKWRLRQADRPADYCESSQDGFVCSFGMNIMHCGGDQESP